MSVMAVIMFTIFFYVQFKKYTYDLQEHTREESCEAVRCKELLNSRISEFVEEILLFYFADLVRFVKDCEIATSRGLTEALRGEESNLNSFILKLFKIFNSFD